MTLHAADLIDICQRGGIIDSTIVRYMSHSVGGRHVPCPTRPQRRRPRRGGRVLLQAVQHRAGQAQAGLRQLRDRRTAAEAGAASRTPARAARINHLGVEVESSDTVHAEIARLSGEGLFTDEEIGTTCCFATQDKVWVTGPAARGGRSTPCSPTATRSARARGLPSMPAAAADRRPFRIVDMAPFARCSTFLSATKRTRMGSASGAPPVPRVTLSGHGGHPP